ncbi:hypothetical protein JOB18_012061 [Solea senegalensis]|nr:hypothetical protein JOB18_012061 [Solea senegalensis]
MVCGISALLLMALHALPKILCSAALDKVWTVCMIILGLFVLIWFFYGSYQIYSVYPPNYEKNITDPDENNRNFFTSAEPDNKLAPALDNRNQSLLNLNQNQSIQNLNQNQSLLNPNQTQTIKNSQTWKRLIQTSAPISSEHLKAPAPQRVSSAVAYCNKTLYLLSFWSTTLIYALAANALLISFCLYGCMALVNILTKYSF